jgi:nitronate monooxygenase
MRTALENPFTRRLGIEVPLIGGAMYPCSNPELVAAVSEAGGIGIIQPISLIYVYKNDFREGIKKIKRLTSKPVGMNALVEKNSKIYEDRMKKWVDIALEEGIRFFITALGNPNWVVEKVHAVGGTVFHDVIDRKWAEKAAAHGVDGLICVNNRAGGHAGTKSPKELIDELKDMNLPLICAGGIGEEKDFVSAIQMGYDGVQMGTRFIATEECAAHSDYKNAILNAKEEDIVRTERVTGVPLSVIRTPYVDKVGLKVGPIARQLFKFRKTRHWIRMYYNIKALRDMKRTALEGFSTKDYWQAGKSVAGISKIEPAGQIVKRFASALKSSS